MGYLDEAFKDLHELEDGVDLQDEQEVKKAIAFMNGDEDNLAQLELIVDADADSEEDIKDTYVGELLLYCPVCHTIHYEKEENIVFDEENDEIVNVGDACPHCKQENGYEIVGKIEEYDATEDETDVENEPTEDGDVPLELDDIEDFEDEETTKKFEESFKIRKRLKEHFDEDNLEELARFTGERLHTRERVRETKKVEPKKSLKESKKTNKALKESVYEYEDDEEFDEKLINYLSKKLDIYDVYGWLSEHEGMYNSFCDDVGCDPDEDVELNQGDNYNIISFIYDEGSTAWDDFLHYFHITDLNTDELLVSKEEILKENLAESPVYGLEPRYDARKSFYGKAQVDTGDKGDKNKLYSYDTLVAEIKDGKPVVYGTYSQTTLRHIKEWLKQLGFKAENSKQILADYGAKRESYSRAKLPHNLKESKKLKEEVQEEAYKIADYVLDRAKGKEFISWDEFDQYIYEAAKFLYNVDLNNYDEETYIIKMNNKEFDVNDLVNDVRIIMAFDGWNTIFEGEDEGGLTTKEIKESCKEAKKLKEVNGQDKYFTQKGRDEMNLSKKLGLSKYYDPMSGIYEIPKSEYDSVKDKVDKLLSTNKNYTLTDGDDTNVSDYKGLMFIELDESCKVAKKTKLKEKVQDEAYAIAEYIYDHIKDRDTITRDEYEEQFALACRELYGIDNVWEIEQDGNIEINGKTFDATELLENDVRGILAYNGYETIYEGDYEGDLTRLGENLKEAKKLKEDAYNEYQRIIDRAKLNIDDGYSDIDEAIWSAIDDEPYLDDFEILKDNFRIDDLYFENGEPVSTAIMELIFNSVYDEVSEYFNEVVRAEQDEFDNEKDENLKPKKRAVSKIKESIKTRLDKSLKEAKETKLSKEAQFLKNAYEDLKDKPTGTHYYDLGLDSGLHLVVGECEDEICVKIAYNCDDLQCDYDYDWNMPLDNMGECAYVEDTLDENTDWNKEAQYLVKEAKAMDKEIANGELVCESCCKGKKRTKKKANGAFKGEKVTESKKRLNEGPGAGYSVKGKVTNVHNVEVISDVESESEYYSNTLMATAECDIVDVHASSYYYGRDIVDGAPIPAKLEIKLDYDKDEYYGDATKVVEALGDDFEFDATLGGGWGHVTFTGVIEGDYHDVADAPYSTDILNFSIKIENENVIKDIDKAVTGEDWVDQYDVIDADGDIVDSFDTGDEAIDYAKNNRGIAVEHRYIRFALLDDFESEDIIDEYNDGTVWEREYTKSYKYDDEQEEALKTKKVPPVITAKQKACKDEECKKKELDESLLVTCDFSDYRPWSGAISTYERIEEEGKLGDLENLLEEIYPEGISMVGINDILWFDWEWVFEELGISDGDEDEEDFDESLFESLVDRYCQRVYDNVRDFKTTSCSKKDKKFIVEGILHYTNGKKAKTTFTFNEAKTTNGKRRFVGLNETFSKDNKAFTLLVSTDNKKLLSESLSYKYNVEYKGEQKEIKGKIVTPKH